MADKIAAPQKMTQEQAAVIQTFQQMRNEQRSMVNKIMELEHELAEHKTVLSTLSEVQPDRKCFRVIGGVLVERTVKEVMPAVANNRDQLEKLIASLNETLVKKGKELTEYREKHDIRIRGQPQQEEKSEAKNKPVQSVLVGDSKSA